MILVIGGPTGVGKTKLSVELAKIYNGEIINGDSTQVYKGMDIGTAKVTKEEKQGIPHHLFDIREPSEEYNLYAYQQDCRNKIDEIKKKRKIPILVGGTGLYLKAALYDYHLSFEEEKDEDFLNLSNEEIYKEILKSEPDIEIDSHNRRRLVRTLNKIRKETLLEEQTPTLLYDDVLFIGLTTDIETLYIKTDARFDQMLYTLVDEVKSLYKKYPNSRALQTAIGYKELIDFFQDKKTFKESVDLIKKKTRNYAKRQHTFFRNQMDIAWFSVNYTDFGKKIQEVVYYIEGKR